jgi:hypothetical protein
LAWPSRYIDDGRARTAHGDRVDRLAPYLLRTDALADEAVAAFDEMPPGAGFAQVERAIVRGIAAVPDAHPAIAALLRATERVPPWVDWSAIDRGGEVLLRAGLFGGLILGIQSLPYGYASPGGNKPLALSGRLTEQAPRRLSETARFVHAVCMPGGLRRGADGYAICVKVRIMHAQVRRLLWDSGRWHREQWGEPINQHDMVATSMLFSAVVLDGLRKLGFRVRPAEAQRYMGLWRYVGWLLGTDLELLPTTEAEALKLADLIMRTQARPDDDSRALTRALFEAGRRGARSEQEKKRAERMHPVATAISRRLLGAELADDLGIERSKLDRLVPFLRGAVSLVDGARSRLHLMDALALSLGSRYWAEVTERGLAGAAAEFAPPGALHPSRA